MLRVPVRSKICQKSYQLRMKSSSGFIRNTFIEYFVQNHGHKHVKSSSVVPLCDPTVPFVNAGMNQFKGVFLGLVDPPHPRVVNSQKCIRVGGKHNDLDLVGLDGTHHTFFEMLGNWSFGDYYKKEACKMAWDLLLGPYRLKPENLLVTYFGGDVAIGLIEDRECRDIWKEIGVPASRIKDCGARDNFWEMGASGPCGPCTEIHYVHPDGSLTEIWNIVFIQCNRDTQGKIHGLRRQHVDTGMGLERMAALLQGAPSNYDTDLFKPIIHAIEKNSKNISPYTGSYTSEAVVDQSYRRLADHARMVSVCLSDGAFPATNLNLKQILRKTFKLCTDVFQNPKLPFILYDKVAESLGHTYPELISKEKDAKVILEFEQDSYNRMRSNLAKKWKDLVKQYPEVEAFSDVEMAGFPLGYKEFKETMKKDKSTTIPGDLVFKLYDTHGFQEDIIERIAKLNNLEIDKKGFWKLLTQHKSRHKTAFKEQSKKEGILFDKAIEEIAKNGINKTNDDYKYEFVPVDNTVQFKPLKTKVVAILNENLEWVDFLEACDERPYYIVTESTNFYTENGGQIADTGVITFNENVRLKVQDVFKIRDFVFHKGYFKLNSDSRYVNNNSEVILEVDGERRLDIMRNHTAAHLLNAAIRKVLPDSVVGQVGSSVSDIGFSLNLAVYGEKLSQSVVLEAQDLVRKAIRSNATIDTRIIDSTQLSSEDSLVTVPGETYPETGIRLVTCSYPLLSKELCCGTHVPNIGVLGDFCISCVKAPNTNTPTLHAITGARATQARELFCRAQKLSQVIDLADPERIKEEVGGIKRELAALCGGGAPYAEYAECLKLLDVLVKKTANRTDVAMQAIAETEIREACQEAIEAGRRFVVHFLRCSYLMQPQSAAHALANTNTNIQTLFNTQLQNASTPNSKTSVPNDDAINVPNDVTRFQSDKHVNVKVTADVSNMAEEDAGELPAMLFGCAGGVIVAVARVPQSLASSKFCAERWLRCVLPVFGADLAENSSPTRAQMTATKVSLINCEQMVQDAMRVAIKFAQCHIKDNSIHREKTEENRQHN